ncbi:MAG: AraC family transcriptional regulator [Bacteroidota bacterium]
MDAAPAFNTLPDFLAHLGYPVPNARLAVHDLADVSPSVPYKSNMFRANYFTFVLLRGGHSRYTLDDETFEVPPRTLYFTNPGHRKGFELLEPPVAKLLSFTEEFLRECIDVNAYAVFPFLLTERVTPQQLSAEMTDELWQLIDRIEQELRPGDPLSEEVAGTYFRVFLLKVKRHLYAHYDPRQEGRGASPIVLRFQRRLRERVAALLAGEDYALPQVQEFADEQAIHPNYLATVISSKTGKTASGWIQEAIVSAARGLLRTSDKSVKEIALQLGFEEPAYFSRYFKRVAGRSPSAFRRELD